MAAEDMGACSSRNRMRIPQGNAGIQNPPVNVSETAWPITDRTERLAAIQAGCSPAVSTGRRSQGSRKDRRRPDKRSKPGKQVIRNGPVVIRLLRSLRKLSGFASKAARLSKQVFATICWYPAIESRAKPLPSHRQNPQVRDCLRTLRNRTLPEGTRKVTAPCPTPPSADPMVRIVLPWRPPCRVRHPYRCGFPDWTWYGDCLLPLEPSKTGLAAAERGRKR